MVGHHAPEPAQLLALMGQVVADVRRGDDGDGQRVGVAAGVRCRRLHRLHGPGQDLRVGELEDEPVGDAPGHVQHPRPVGGHPHREVPTVGDPGEPHRGVLVVDLLAGHQALDHPDRVLGLGQRLRAPPDDPQRRIAPAHPQDGARPEVLVERGEHRGEHRPVAGARVGHHRADDHPLGLRQHQRVDDERLLPEHVAVEGPPVGEAVRLGSPSELEHPRHRRVGLQHDPEAEIPVGAHTFWGKPRLTPRWLGSGQRLVTTLPLV